MRHIFSPQGIERLRSVLERRPLLAFDFDGTLAPIVASPDAARIAPNVERGLSELVERLPVAIVSGRDIADVRARLGFDSPHIVVVGNHGAEFDLAGKAPAWLATIQAAREWLAPYRQELQALGVQVEDKRRSLALHYRRASNRALAKQRLQAILSSTASDLSVFGGKLVFNIVAADAPDKADAVRGLVKATQSAAAIFVGDDVNDEPVFESAPNHWLTIKVGRTSRRSKAHFYLGSPHEMNALLDHMLAVLDQGRRHSQADQKNKNPK